MKDKKGYKLYNFIIIYLVPIIHLVNLLSSINIAHNLMTQKVIKFNSLLIKKKRKCIHCTQYMLVRMKNMLPHHLK